MRKDRWVGVWGLIFAAGGFYACIDSSATTRGNGMETVADAGSTGSAAPANIDKSGLLQSIISNVIAPTHSAFIAAAVELEAAVNVYADTLDEADRVKAQQAFAAAMKLSLIHI